MQYRETYTLLAEDRSLATRFQSACAAMQASRHARAEAPLALPKRGQLSEASGGSSERQVRLHLDATIGGLSLELLPDEPHDAQGDAALLASATPKADPAPLASVALRALALEVDARRKDIRAAVRLQAADVQVSVVDTAVAASPRRSVDSGRPSRDSPTATPPELASPSSTRRPPISFLVPLLYAVPPRASERQVESPRSPSVSTPADENPTRSFSRRRERSVEDEASTVRTAAEDSASEATAAAHSCAEGALQLRVLVATEGSPEYVLSSSPSLAPLLTLT